MQGAALAKAKLMAPSMTQQYQIFKLDQMELERMALEDNDNMDMASYAEFQRQFKGLKEAHRQVLFAIRAFWQVLTRHDIQYLTLVSHFKKVEQSQTLVSLLQLCTCLLQLNANSGGGLHLFQASRCTWQLNAVIVSHSKLCTMQQTTMLC